ncbi:MAG TPA: hypothetical protein VJ973_10165, partial [Christiangramia sp.]|nr:hypothetical protein [Christiangramia sp.]
MKISTFLRKWNILFLILTTLAYSQSSTETVNIPDPNFEQALIDLGIDSDGTLNSTVLRSDVENVEGLYIPNRNIASLEGIEAFANLKFLRAWDNLLTSLDVSGNPELVHLSVANNSIGSLDLRNNVLLSEIYAYANALTNLQISANDQLIHLSVSDNDLTNLELSGSSALVDIYISNNNLSSVNLGNHPNLVNFHAGGNSIDLLDFSNSPALRSLLIWGSNLSSIDLSNNLQLEELDLNSNNLSGLDLSNNPNLRFAYCGSNNLNFLNIANGNNLGMVKPEWSEFSFVASGNPNLACIQVDEEMVEVNRADWGKDARAIYSSDCVSKPEYVAIPDSNFEQALIDNGIDTGIVNGWLLKSRTQNITYLNIPNRSISSLQGINAFQDLRELNAYDNQITALDVSENNQLVNLSLANNQITNLDLSSNNLLEQIHVNRNAISNLILGSNPNLWGIFAGGNNLNS